MVARLVVASLIWTLPAVSQVAGTFYLEKTQFSPTEPVFVYLAITNRGHDPVNLFPGNPEQPMCSGVSFDLFREGTQTDSCPFFAEKVCVMNGPLSQPVPLGPGRSHTDRYLLNYHHDLSRAGRYRLEAERIGFPGNQLQSLKATLLFRIDADAAPIAAGEIQALVNQLHSPDYDKRVDAPGKHCAAFD